VLGVNEHLHGEHQRWQWLGALVVHEPFGDGDGAAGLERAESFLEQLPTAFLAFTVQDVTKRRHGVPTAEVSLQQIAGDIGIALGQPEFAYRFPGDFRFHRLRSGNLPTDVIRPPEP